MTQIITRNPETDEVIGIYDIEIKHIRNPLKLKSENWKETKDTWLVTINGQNFEYFTGVGHRKTNHLSEIVKSTYKRKNWIFNQDLKTILKATKPVLPDFDSVLACLVHAAVGSSQVFDDWCHDFGYPSDSREALQTYSQSRDIAKKLRLARVPIEKEAERLQDY